MKTLLLARVRKAGRTYPVGRPSRPTGTLQENGPEYYRQNHHDHTSDGEGLLIQTPFDQERGEQSQSPDYDNGNTDPCAQVSLHISDQPHMRCPHLHRTNSSGQYCDRPSQALDRSPRSNGVDQPSARCKRTFVARVSFGSCETPTSPKVPNPLTGPDKMFPICAIALLSRNFRLLRNTTGLLLQDPVQRCSLCRIRPEQQRQGHLLPLRQAQLQLRQAQMLCPQRVPDSRLP